MNGIQVILLFFILILGVWIFSKDFLPWVKALGLLLVGLGGYFVLLPEHANVMAQHLNVGRGADLMLYFFVIGSIFYSISTYQKIKDLERATTQLFREKALEKAVKLGERGQKDL